MRPVIRALTPNSLTPNSPAITLLGAHILSMLGFATYAALLPELRDLWGLTNAQAGVVSGMFFGGYVATVSLWSALTDRVDGRRVYLAGSLLAAAGSAGFGLAAAGYYSAMFFQALLGIGIAATYMPGLRLLSDRLTGPYQSRYIAFYTSFFGIGTALSLALAGVLAEVAGWRTAFLVSALGPFAAGFWVYLRIAPKAAAAQRRFSLAELFPLAAWRKVLAQRASAGYTLGYFVHCLELFGSRAWMVAFLAYAGALNAGDTFPWPAAAIAAVINLMAVPASILGNEVALKIGRKRWIMIAMAASGGSGLLVALAAPWHWTLVLVLLAAYAMLVMAESGTLTAGLVGAVGPSERGAALGLYSLAGFGGGLLGPIVFGAALDAAGGAQRGLAWLAGYGAIGLGCLLAPLVGRIAAERA